MMARQHVTFAVGVYTTALGTAAYFNDAVEDWVRESPFSALASVLLVAGLALLPDLDHHSSTMTKKLGWLGAILHWLLRVFGIRHRGFLHTFLFAVISGVAFWFLAWLTHITPWASILLGVMLLFFASITFAFIFGRVGRNPVLVLALAGLMIWGHETGALSFDGYWVAVAGFAGPLLHDLGDMFTHGRLAFWYPFSKAKYGAPLTFRTGSLFESVLLRGVFFAWSLLGIGWVVMLSTGYITRAEISAENLADPAWWTNALPYVAWAFV